MILFLWIGWNVLTLMLFGIDKLCAMAGARRIPEKLLLSAAFCMGGVGAGLGMLLFRHKIRNRKFCVLVPVFVVINLAVFERISGLIVSN